MIATRLFIPAGRIFLAMSIAIALLAGTQLARADILGPGYLVVSEGISANSQVGWSVGSAGDVNGDGYSDILVNSQDNNGTVRCYHGGPDPVFGAPNWTVSNGGAFPGWLFGSVSTAGDVNGDGYDDVMVSAPWLSHPETDEGVVYVYLGAASGLSTTPNCILEQNVASANFGQSIDAAGDVNGDGFDDVIIGSPRLTNPLANEGRASVYLGSAGGLSTSPAWQYEGEEIPAQFGARVAGTGDVNADGYDDILVSAPYHSNGESEEGRVSLFYGSPTGPVTSPSWSYEPNLAGARCGWGMGLAGDINGDGYSDLAFKRGIYGSTSSSILVFFGDPVLPDTFSDLSYPTTLGTFGDVLYTAGDVNGDGFADLVAAQPDASGGVGEVSILSFDGGDALLSRLALLTGEQSAELSGSGARSAGDVNGDGFGDVIVGAPRWDNGGLDRGIARLYLGHGGVFDDSKAWSVGGGQMAAQYGAAVVQGDWNGDGVTDLAVGSPGRDLTWTDQGMVSVYYGSEHGYGQSPNLNLQGSYEGGRFGFALANAGDVNGDGFEDLLVGEPYAGSFDYPEIGCASLYLGTLSGLGTSPAWSVTGGIRPGHMGWSVAGAGDVNGDGFADVVIGSPDYSFVPLDRGGRAQLYLGSTTGLLTTTAWQSDGGNTGDRYGYSVAGVGDVNGDGYDDFAVGAPNKELGGFTDEGFSYVYFGSASGVSGSWSTHSNASYSYSGATIAGLGDVNGDGRSDFSISTPYADLGGILDLGMVEVWLGSSTNVPVYDLHLYGAGSGDEMGWAVAGGDVNNDGFSDLAIGSILSDTGGSDAGTVYLHLGGPGGIDPTAEWQQSGVEPSGYFGTSLSMRGDATGDGFADLLVGERIPSALGKAHLYYGGRENAGSFSRDGVTRRPRQSQINGLVNIAAGAGAAQPDQFLTTIQARSARGRAFVRTEYQVSPNGVTWTGPILPGSAGDTGAPMPVFGSLFQAVNLISGLSSGTAYHWRMRFCSDSPYFPRSPWFSVPGNSATERDVRTASSSSGVDDDLVEGSPLVPAAMSFSRVGPNPCRDELLVRFALPAAGPTRLTIHDASGRRVATVFEGEVPSAGEHAAHWNVRDEAGVRLPAGAYFLHLQQGTKEISQKVIVRR